MVVIAEAEVTQVAAAVAEVVTQAAEVVAEDANQKNIIVKRNP